MTFIKGGYSATIQLKVNILWFLLLTLLIAPSQAKEVSALSFNTPKTLLTHKVENKQDAIDLLQSKVLQQQLISLAQQIEATHPSKLSTQESISLSSILSQHKRTLTLIDEQKYPFNFYHYLIYTKAQQTPSSSKKIIELQIQLQIEQQI